jgi:pectin methylesterase-like acyl-CoA thioesterase
MTFNIQRPVYVDGNTVVVYLPSKPLTYNQTYYVNVASGAIKNPSGAAFVVTGSTAWRFTTAAAAPTNKAAVGVALDGSAPFCSLQGALDFVPANNTAAVTVSIANGTYHEIVYFKSKSNVSIQGASQTGTTLEGTNNNNLNPSTKGRALMGGDSTNGLTVNNLTIHNLTPQGGSQAEALRLEGCDKCVVTNATIISLQDTLLWSGRIYAHNDLIEGNVDFVWGTGAVYFDTCEIRTIGRSGPVVQARNTSSTYGYVFVDSKITADAGLTGGVLARIDVGTYPASHVAYINCQMTPEIVAAGWQLTAGTDVSQLRFWEYQSVDANGNPINTGSRLNGSKQLTAAQAAMMRDPSVVLAGWTPPAN